MSLNNKSVTEQGRYAQIITNSSTQICSTPLSSIVSEKGGGWGFFLKNLKDVRVRW